MKPATSFRTESRPAIGLAVLILVLTTVILLVSNLSASSEAVNNESAAQTDKIIVSLALYATGLKDPVGIANAGPNDDRLFVLERSGIIRIVRANGSVDATPFMTITDRVDDTGGEMGLLGLAFDPEYADNGTFYVNYTSSLSGTRQTRISRFVATADPDIADRDSEEIILTLDQPAHNHNAGAISFGPDNYLYIPLGDTGANAAFAQDMTTIAGKVSRIDVRTNAGSPSDCSGVGTGDYKVPADNPLVDGAGSTCDEIWAIGLRNPWQSSFDRQTGDFYIGDVGPNTWEEIDRQPADSTGGENYGWPCYEGNHEYNLSGCGPAGDYDFPVFEYNHDPGGCAVVGGYVYRGSQFPAMVGRYLLTDYCSGFIWDLAPDGNGGWITSRHATNIFGFSAFGETSTGELLLANRSNGNLYQLRAEVAISRFLPLILKQ